MNTCSHCDRERLRLLLNEGLPDAVESELADHVASCPICQNELESLAAVRDWWEEASHRLSQSSAEVPSLRIGAIEAGDSDSNGPGKDWNFHYESHHNERSSRARSFLSSEFSDEAYASDFAVDFLEPSDDSAVLGRLGEYEIVQVIGRGGMGIVLKGFQKELHRFVAVKVLAPHLATSGAARRRFAREAQATAAVVNPHVMAIHSVHADFKLPYLVMPFIDCESLQQRLDHAGPLDLKDVLRIGMQAALGLAAAHAQGLVHRDVKPANILLETNVDRVMLTDFGLARAVDDATLTRTGIIAGTPQYMSPEQANGDAVDHRSDLFSLGSVLYAMCTARPPFRAETTFGVLRRIRETDPRPIREINSDIPEWLEYFVGRLLSKDPKQRFSTATEVAGLLERSLAHVQQPTTIELPSELEPPVVPLTDRPQRLKVCEPHFMRWGIAVTALLTIMGILLVMLQPAPRKFEDSAVHNAEVLVSAKIVESSSETSGNQGSNDPMLEWNQTQFDLNEIDQSLNPIESRNRAEIEELNVDGEELNPSKQ